MNTKNYLYGFVSVAILAFVAILIYETISPKNSAKSKRIECQKQSTTFERVYAPEAIDETIKALKSGNIQTKYKMLFSVHTPTQMGQYFTIEEVNEDLLEILSRYEDTTIQSQKPLVIDYHLYENDINDPGKKSKEAKKYAGYIRMNFYLGSTRVYSNQIDFLDFEGKDIKDRLQCAIDSLITLQ